MKVLASAFVGLELADTILTMWAVQHGFMEANPLMATLATTWWFPVVKLLPAILVACIVVWVARRNLKLSRPAKIGFACCILFLAAVLVSNLMEMGGM